MERVQLEERMRTTLLVATAVVLAGVLVAREMRRP